MRVFDAPIHANDQSWPKILQMQQPLVLYIFDTPHQAIDRELQQIAHQHASELLVVRIDVSQNPETFARYHFPALPALLTFKEGKQQTAASSIRAVDIASHVAYLLGNGPKPAEEPASAVVDTPINVTDQTFQRAVLQSDVPVLVDFWAPWCGPCRAVAPIVEQIAKKYAGRIKVAKVNVDENPRTASTYQTMSIPTLIMFNHSQAVKRLVGVQPQAVLENLIQQTLQKP